MKQIGSPRGQIALSGFFALLHTIQLDVLCGLFGWLKYPSMRLLFLCAWRSHSELEVMTLKLEQSAMLSRNPQLTNLWTHKVWAFAHWTFKQSMSIRKLNIQIKYEQTKCIYWALMKVNFRRETRLGSSMTKFDSIALLEPIKPSIRKWHPLHFTGSLLNTEAGCDMSSLWYDYPFGEWVFWVLTWYPKRELFLQLWMICQPCSLRIWL